ncbi:MAG: 4-alpha-glucanotransferase, partial [Oligoflexia bacterium]|nr:4-alpha-glucanotransferase [Oligoflexia bacterium]
MTLKNENAIFRNQRSSGILLPLNALPGKFGIGSIGISARKFVDYLVQAGQKYWQICPLGHIGEENSPYNCYSAFAGNPFLIDLEELKNIGLLDIDNIDNSVLKLGSSIYKNYKKNFINYEEIKPFYLDMLDKAFKRFMLGYSSPLNLKNLNLNREFTLFKKDQHYWLKDYAFFMALKDHFKNDNWAIWPEDIKYRKPPALQYYKRLLKWKIEFYFFIQFIFFKQWHDLLNYAHKRGVFIIGDVPIYISYRSADVWAHPQQFLLDKYLHPSYVAGVPADYFSKTGQYWGNPLYNWKFMEKTNFKWWISVFMHLTSCFD